MGVQLCMLSLNCLCWKRTEDSEGRSGKTNVRAVSILGLIMGADVSPERESLN